MDKDIKFSVTADIISRRIAEINLVIANHLENDIILNELNALLKDQDILFKGSKKEVEKILEKYWSNN